MSPSLDSWGFSGSPLCLHIGSSAWENDKTNNSCKRAQPFSGHMCVDVIMPKRAKPLDGFYLDVNQKLHWYLYILEQHENNNRTVIIYLWGPCGARGGKSPNRGALVYFFYCFYLTIYVIIWTLCRPHFLLECIINAFICIINAPLFSSSPLIPHFFYSIHAVFNVRPH